MKPDQVPSAPNAPESVNVGMLPKKRKKWPWFLLLGVLVAGGAGGYYWWTTREVAAPQPEVVKSTAKDMTFAPRFSTVAGYVKFDGAEWYAADAAVIKIKPGTAPQYFSHREGLPVSSLTGLVVHKDQLWVGSQRGTAVLKADGSGFTEVAVGGKTSAQEAVQNGRLYQDAGGTLYLGAFTDFYRFNDTSKAWELVSGVKPVNASNVVFNENFGAASANALGSPIWVYSKASNSWKLSPIAGMEDQTSSVFAIGGDLFIMGRQKGYTSCQEAGKLTATVAYHLDAAGAWQPLTAFNADKARPELIAARHIKDATATAYTSPCGNEKRTGYDLAYANGALTLTNQRTLSGDSGVVLGDVGGQDELVAELSKATGLYPYTQALAVDKDDNVIFSYSKSADWGSVPYTNGLAVAEGSDFTKSKALEIAGLERYDDVRPVMCEGTLKYAFVGKPGAGEGGPTYDWATAKLLSVNGTKTAQVADLGKDVASPVFSCTGQKITWLGRSGLKQYDASTKALSDVGSPLGTNLTTLTGQTTALPNGDLWLVVSPEDPTSTPGTIYYYDAAKAALAKVGASAKQPLLQAGSSEHVWVSGPRDGDSTSLTMYDKAGKKIYAKTIKTPLYLAETGAAAAIVANGTTDQSVMRPLQFATLDAAGTSAAIQPEKVPVHLGYESGWLSGGDTSLYDAGRKLMWVTDFSAGLFAVPLP